MLDNASTAPTFRLFVAIQLSDAWRGWLSRLSGELRSRTSDAYRWVRPELMHITLCFLGSQSTSAVPRILEALEHAAALHPPFQLWLGDVGTFGGRRPRVLWIGVQDPASGLQRLRRALDVELDRQGIEFDRKPLSAHITLARARGSGMVFDLRTPASSPPPGFTVTRVVLISSLLGAGGPRYEVIASGDLA